MDERAGELERFATEFRDGDIVVRKARVSFDEQLDGEPVTRVLLLLDDPEQDTWNFDSIRKLHHDLRRRAVELGLPWVSVSLVPVSERDIVAAFDG